MFNCDMRGNGCKKFSWSGLLTGAGCLLNINTAVIWIILKSVQKIPSLSSLKKLNVS